MTEKDILQIIKADAWMMEALHVAQKQHLPDWWIGAGFVRNKIWDVLHGYAKRTSLNDVDVIYYDPKDLNESTEKEIEKRLKAEFDAPWSAKNQARMAIVRNVPFKNAVEGLASWVETATCVGVKLTNSGDLELTDPRGINDLVNLVLKPTPGREDIFHALIYKKNWLQLWPKLVVAV
jgi:hypothetical protein